MMLTLLYPLLLLESWSNALPQTPYKISHLQPQPGTIVTLKDVSNEPQTGTTDIVSRQTRQIPRDWLYPTFNPPSSYNSNRRSQSSSVGLAYRSIIPQSSNHYTNYYRNRNLYTGAPARRKQQEPEQSSSGNKNDENLDLSPKSTINTSPNSESSGTPGLEWNYNDIVNSNYNNPDLTISSSHTSTTSNTIITTTVKVPSSLETSETSFSESIFTTPEPRSAPATEDLPAGRLSSTLQMQINEDGDEPDLDGDVSARDAIGFGVSKLGSISSGNTNTNTQRREPKAPNDPVLLTDEMDSVIIFPGNISRSYQARQHLKQSHNDRPGKSSLGDDEGYIPPPLKTLDRAALQSLRRLIEARKRAVPIDTRLSNGPNSKNNNNRVPQSSSSSDTKSLEINKPPSCATESGYCEEIDTYPKEFLNQVLKKSVSPDVFQEVFGDSIENNTVATDVVGRNDLQDTPLCNSIEHTIYPKVARNRDGKFMYVVNHDEYIQGVRVEKCVGENNQCMFQEGNPTGYQSTCRQKFIYKKLLAFTPEGKAMTDTFRLPSCCVCYLRSAFVGDRINAAGLNTNSNNNNEHDSSNKDSTGTGINPKNSASDLPLDDDKNLTNSTTVNLSTPNLPVTTASSTDMNNSAATTLSTSTDEAESLSEIIHDEHFIMDGLHDDLTTHGMNDTLSDLITSGPFFRSF